MRHTWTALQRGIGGALVAALVGACALVGTAAPASADFELVPSSPNGQKVYLSRACHDRGTGSCQPNYGCFDFNENLGSRNLSNTIPNTYSGRAGLLERGYRVRVGTGLTSENISSSNSWGATMHVPLHSNASTFDCSGYSSSRGGTWPMYLSENGRQLAVQLDRAVSPSSPGTNDKTVYRSDLGELNQTRAVAAYLESAFHTYGPDVDWLNRPQDWSWLIGSAIDHCRGYPRNGVVTATKQCTW